ncbi:hypothetical protein Flexsi_1039 [Flexistipes sinusarabici DSM 4947]|uniref:Uncharacterized protein n=1 Tax=Flexistipes sinusarabici (strain ATCC 49648 / DSM 4947 / MAS 10) TaxID=717231 RepID=F8E5R6_FLESM|nr:hypothetical protein [Flexistipes sinusarabici]AEI14697.1 hypothetical protein Flexsi_1039 [Flexistipes sinusarabici DSM 4947]
MAVEYTELLNQLKNKKNLNDDEMHLLKSMLTLKTDLSAHIHIFKKFHILDNITAEMYSGKSTENQVKSILTGDIPIHYDYYPVVVFLVLKNYRNQVKELYDFLNRLKGDILKDIITSPYFEGKYIQYLTRLMKNNDAFVSVLISQGKINEVLVKQLAKSTNSDVLFSIANLKIILENNQDIINELLMNPYTPDDSVVYLKQIKYELSLNEALKSTIETEEMDETEEEKKKVPETLKKEVEKRVEGENKEIEENLYQKILNMKPVEKIKLALKGNKSARGLLLKDSNKQISLTVLKNPRITEDEIESLVKSKSTPEHLIREISRNRNFMKEYDIKKGMVMHPKTPLEISMRLINHLYVKDIEQISKSREVPSALKNQALRLFMTKSGAKK